MTTADTFYTLAIVYLIIAIVLPIALVIVFGIFLLCYLEKKRKMALSGLVTPDMIPEEMEELPPYSEAP
jgi:tryptophan synthase alpha subunit